MPKWVVAIPAVCVVVIVAAAGFGLGARWGSDYFGTLSSWASALGSLAAVSVALWVAGEQSRIRLRDEHRDQAEHISAAYSGEKRAKRTILSRDGEEIEVDDEVESITLVFNSSKDQIYNVVIFNVLIQGGGPRRGEEMAGLNFGKAIINSIPPGTWEVRAVYGGAGMSKAFGAEIAFTDRRGAHWIKRSDGKLEEIEVSPIDYYSIGRPLGFSKLHSVS